jgi:hypothetical protein
VYSTLSPLSPLASAASTGAVSVRVTLEQVVSARKTIFR